MDDNTTFGDWGKLSREYAARRAEAGTPEGIAYTAWLESLPPAEAAAEIGGMFALCAPEDRASEISCDLQMDPEKAQLIAMLQLLDQFPKVIAVEPSSGMRSEGQRLHPDPRIRWINDQLPELSILDPLAISFDVVMMTAAWQHLPPSQRDRAFCKIAALVRTGGLLAISLRSGPSPAGSEMHPVSLKEIERLARNHGFAVEKVQQAADQQGRVEVSWTSVALRLPDDGTGALPLLCHVILNDQKSATYKLGLLRALCRAADGSAGMVQKADDGFMRVPLGLVALNWLRSYLPLIRESLPQTPTNVGAQRTQPLVFVRCATRGQPSSQARRQPVARYGAGG